MDRRRGFFVLIFNNLVLTVCNLIKIYTLFACITVMYCDYAASGRALNFLEEYVAKEILPFCGNARTSVNVTALQSSLYRYVLHHN